MIPISSSVEPVSTYKDFFGLGMNPFDLSPDPFFLYTSERNKEALSNISQAIHQRKGFIVMTGEVGTGKTLVLRCLFELWEREQTPFAYFIGPRLSTTDFLSYITYELGIEVADPSKGNLLRALYGFLLAQFERGLTTVLVIDEAHQIPRNVLEEIRLLANFETAQQKLIQILLVGQPELDKKLDAVELRSLKQRITVRCQLHPLHEEEIGYYIERRLELAGADPQAETIFPPDTIRAIYRYSLGIPRLVNSICDQALTAAFLRQVRVVPVEVVEEVASQFRLNPASNSRRAEKPLSPVSRIDTPVPDKSLQAPPAPNASGAKVPNQGAIFGNLGAAYESPARAVEVPSNGKVSPKISVREDAAPHKSRLTQRIIIVAVVTVIALALPTGYIMARRRMAAVKAPSHVTSAPDSLPEAQAVSSLQPTALTSTTPVDASSVGAMAAPIANRNSAPTGVVQHPTADMKTVVGTLSKPVRQTPQVPISTDPPLITGAQTKVLDFGKSIPEMSTPKPLGSESAPNSNVSEPKLISATRPVYPAMARLSNSQGSVTVSMEVDPKGNVASATAISGPIVLRQAAVDAVKQWKYSPAMIDGRPAGAQVTVDVTFRLN